MVTNMASANVPNFREDERVRARYQSMLERRIKAFGIEHEGSIRRNAAAKRDELRDQLDAAQREYDRCKEAADAAREAYRSAYPQHVKKARLEEPSVIENMRSLGAASKLYHEAQAAWLAAEHATSDLRRIEHNEDQLEIELKKALERAPQVAKEVTESAKWLAEIHAEEDLAAAKAKVDEIDAERAAFAKRLAAGEVPPEELHERSFAEADIKHIAFPLKAVMFYRIDRFGPASYAILRDMSKQLYALPYDRRLEAVFDGIYDVVQNGTTIEVRRTMRENTRMPLSAPEHFAACNDKQDLAVQGELLEHRRFIGENRMIATMSEVDEQEAALIAAFAAFASGRAA